MDSKLTANNEEVRALYWDAKCEDAFTQDTEAFDIGVDRKTISNWLNPKMPQCNIPVGALPLSGAKEKFLTWLSQECGVVFVPMTGEFNGTSTEEIRAIGNAFAKLYEEENPARRKKLLTTISQQALAAIKEEGL